MNNKSNLLILIKVAIFSLIGIGLFFVNFTVNGKSTIGIDHIVSFIINNFRYPTITVVLVIMIYGLVKAYYQIFNKWNYGHFIFTLIRTLGLVLTISYLTEFGYEWMFKPDMLPFLFEKLTLALGALIPIGAVALTFLIGFGLIEFIGVFVERFMRLLFKTPGNSAVDALASFVGSYSIGLLITSNMYKNKRYTFKEAIIIATGFSTVSVTFMVVIAKTLNLIDSWNYFFWSTLIITFLVTAITSHIPPISLIKEARTQIEQEEEAITGNIFIRAIQNCLLINHHNPSFFTLIRQNLVLGINMASIITTSVIAIGFIGLVIAKFSDIFVYIGYIFSPFFYLTFIDGAVQHSGQVISGAAEMFLPAILLKEQELGIRYLAAVIPISSIIFLSGTIPSILATEIPIKFYHLLGIWFIRTALSIVFTGIAYHIGIYFNLL